MKVTSRQTPLIVGRNISLQINNVKIEDGIGYYYCIVTNEWRNKHSLLVKLTVTSKDI